MTNLSLNIERVNALPAPLQPSTMYIVKAASNSLAELYFSDATGVTSRRLLNTADVVAIVNAAIQASGTGGSGTGATTAVLIEPDITSRNSLTLTSNSFVLVTDATGDSSVRIGSALYLWNSATSTWIKLTDYQSMDVVLQWANMQGGPVSTPASIDSAVAMKHSHANKLQLDKITEDANGNLLYNGNYPAAGITVSEW